MSRSNNKTNFKEKKNNNNNIITISKLSAADVPAPFRAPLLSVVVIIIIVIIIIKLLEVSV